MSTTGGVLLSYELRTRHPTQRGNLRLVVDEEGRVRVQRNDTDPPDGEQWAADLPEDATATVPDAADRLRSLLEAGGFFEMEERQEDEAVTDGTVRTLSWYGAGGPRTVTVDRARSAGFDRLVGELARLTGVPGR